MTDFFFLPIMAEGKTATGLTTRGDTNALVMTTGATRTATGATNGATTPGTNPIDDITIADSFWPINIAIVEMTNRKYLQKFIVIAFV